MRSVGTNFQTPLSRNLDRADHVWVKVVDDKGRFIHYKCLLCGGVVEFSAPPSYPTSQDFMPDRYVPLTEDERLRSKGR